MDYIFDNDEIEEQYFDEVSNTYLSGENEVTNYPKSIRDNRKEEQYQMLNKMKSKKPFFYQANHNIGPCSCGMEYDILDLGHSYFPRYINSMVCKEASCGKLYKCNARNYQVSVLKTKKPTGKNDGISCLLSGNLKHQWTSELVDVVVGCECIPSKEI
ncbi:hypothetical protein HHI36_013689 [Cryptolaemus montrouzieri]|uniref:Prothoracicotropic hormone n=1 Tax=Cryptolaemus montrouzieri TaxID=559131 RepID=A0ABD2NIX7_9CUCU